MKLVGAILLLGAALEVRRGVLRRLEEWIAAGEELCLALDRLHRGVYRLRRPLPELLTVCAGAAERTGAFWAAVAAGMAERRAFPEIWQGALELLPPPYDTLMAPAGQALTAGEREDLIHLTREEVYRAVQEGRRRLGERRRLATALCLSGALLLIVVLL